MNITKENFDKLKQLDRIEFRQKHDIINEGSGSAISILMYIAGFLTIITFIVLNIILNINYHEGKNAALEFARDISPLYSMSLFLFIIIIIFGLVGWLIKKYRLTKLEQEYFIIEVNKK